MGFVQLVIYIHMVFCVLEMFFFFVPKLLEVSLFLSLHRYMEKWTLPLRKKIRDINPSWGKHQDYAPILLGVIFFVSLSLHYVLKKYIWVLLLAGILNFFPQIRNHPFVVVIYKLTDPFIKKIRTHIDSINGFDLSYVIAIIVVQILYWIW